MNILGVDFQKYPECPKQIPDEILDERWAAVIHSQTLKRLNERGGMSPSEVLLNIRKGSYKDLVSIPEAIPVLIEIVKKYELSKLQGEENSSTKD